MGATADAALSGGAEVIGVLPLALQEREIAHRGLTKLHLVGSMHERKALMASLSDAFIALPGGYGTLDELFELLTLVQTRKMRKPMPIVLFGTQYWKEIVNFKALADHQTINVEDIDLMYQTDSVDEAYDWIVKQLAEKAIGQPGATL